MKSDWDTSTQVRKTITDLKHPDDFRAIARIPVKHKQEVLAFLRPVPSELKGDAISDARLMSEWRNLHRTAFFTWITATESSTNKWLSDRYAPDDEDLMFMIETPGRVPFGHLALYNFQSDGTTCEFGRVLRGTGVGPAGGMTLGASTLLRWAVSKLNVRRIFLEVFKDNQEAVSLYQRLGFCATDTVPLRRVDAAECTRWEKIRKKALAGGAADGYALRMETTAEQLLARAEPAPHR